MKGLPSYPFESLGRFRRKGMHFRFETGPVKAIANDRRADMGHMNPHLMRSPGFEAATNDTQRQRVVPPIFRRGVRLCQAIGVYGFIIGNRNPALGSNRHFDAGGRMARDLRLDPAGARRWFPPYERQILAAKLAGTPMIGKLRRKASMRGIAFRRDHDPACVLIEPVDDAGPRNAAYAGKAVPAMSDKRVDERALQVPRSWVNHKTGWFIYHDKAIIFINNVESDRFARDRVGLGGRDRHLETVAAADPHARAGHGPALHP